VGAARRLFAERGYADVGTEEIVRAAGVTRGALYHQFTDKRDLFEAVVEAVEQDLMTALGPRIADAVAAGDPLGALRAGSAAFLDLCRDPAVERITLIDAPVVLGWERWRELGQQYALGMIDGVLAAAIEAGQLAPQPTRPLAHLLLGAIDEAALYVARAVDPEVARAETFAGIELLLEGLRVRT
jgi:AcrR family transcriptional regulator